MDREESAIARFMLQWRVSDEQNPQSNDPCSNWGSDWKRGGSLMGQGSVPEIGLQQIDAILKYLPVFEKQGYQFGRWVEPEGQFPYFSFSPEVDEFMDTLYKQDMIIPFDWTSWRKEAERYQSDPEALETADLLTLRKLLTVHVRADRFVEGYLASVFESGHITAILHRLKQIRQKMT